MTCRDVTSFIADYFAGELDPGIRQVFERHLSRCVACTRYLADYQRALALGQRAYDDDEQSGDVPDDLVSAILAARAVLLESDRY